MSMSNAETDNNYCLPWPMRLARKAKPHGGDRKAWWYISPAEINVYVEGKDGAVHSCTLTRDQLARALQVIEQG
jgi:hypothetical protein